MALGNLAELLLLGLRRLTLVTALKARSRMEGSYEEGSPLGGRRAWPAFFGQAGVAGGIMPGYLMKDAPWFSGAADK
jgi:hypothetical protein